MKIGFLAMSGVRIQNEALLAAGLTLPGFVERSKVIASLPSLSMLTLAALTPPDVEVEYREVRELSEADDLPDWDLAAITTLSAQAFDAYAIADRFRARGTTVVMGGLHVTSVPDEALEHADAVVVGEGEPTWPCVVADFRAGRLQRVYRNDSGSFDLTAAPMPRFDLLDVDRYNRIPVQTARGCPHRCEFCASSILITPKYRVKPVAKVIAEIRRIKEIWPHPFVELADDNSFVSRPHAKELLRALKRERIHWFTEADISIAEDEELLDALRDSGCRQVLIGLESPSRAALDGLELRRNWKRDSLPAYERAIRRIQSRGITVNGCFILGLDGDTTDCFDAVAEFAERVGLYEVQVTVLTPFPGTPLYSRLLREGRILEPGNWSLCTLFDVNFRPTGMSPDQLRQGIIDLSMRLYAPDAVRERRERFFRDLRAARRVA
jgi:radical SAM superfamily enzyme YgiQ (UPF0313 family)